MSKNPSGLTALKERIRFWNRRDSNSRTDKGLGRSAIARLLTNTGIADITRYELYPSSQIPSEILGHWGRIPISRKGVLATLLDKAGILSRLHSGYLFVGYGDNSEQNTCLQEILSRISQDWGTGCPRIDWVRCLKTGSVIIALTNTDGDPAILKIPLKEGAKQSSSSHKHAVDRFLKNNTWAQELVPARIAEGQYLGVDYSVEKKMLGVPGSELLRSRNAVLKMGSEITRFLELIGKNHRTSILMDEDNFKNTVGQSVKIVVGQYPTQADLLVPIEDKLQQLLMGKRIPLTFAHGDLNASNALFSKRTRELTGIIDWDNARESHLPLRDIVDFLVSTHRYRDGISYGAVVGEFLKGGPLVDKEKQLIVACARDSGLSDELVGPMLIIHWLRNLETTATVNPRLKSMKWQALNISEPAAQILKYGSSDFVLSHGSETEL